MYSSTESSIGVRGEGLPSVRGWGRAGRLMSLLPMGAEFGGETGSRGSWRWVWRAEEDSCLDLDYRGGIWMYGVEGSYLFDCFLGVL